MDQLNIEDAKTGKSNVFYYYDKNRADLDDLYIKQGQFSNDKSSSNLLNLENSPDFSNSLEVFLDFENTPLQKETYVLDFAFKVLLNPTETTEKNSAKEDYLYARFGDFFVPTKEFP